MITRVAALAYPITELSSFDQFRDKQARLVNEAISHEAKLLVFPEYATMELTSILPPSQRGDLSRELEGLKERWEDVHAVYRALAQEHSVTIVAPSAPLEKGEGFVNSAHVFSTQGRSAIQEKLQMTRFERETWGVHPGARQHVFATPHATLGVAICYDAEFPLLVRRLVAGGADIVAVPSCTDTLAGYHRVSLSCRARALENQCFVVQASTVGSAPWSLALDVNRGAAAIYGPVDNGFSDDGIVVQGALDVPGWVYADLDTERMAQVRRDGQVTNHRDWDLPNHLDGQVTRVSL